MSQVEVSNINVINHLEQKKYKTKCPKCELINFYSPRNPNADINKMTFTCKRCRIKSRVVPHIIQVIEPSTKVNKKSTKHQQDIIKEEEKDSSINPLPIKDPGFFKFCRWLSFPAYKGLFKWQKEHHEITWDAEFEMTLAPRDHGKSMTYTMKYEWALQYKEMDVLLLGWTDRRKEIALYVYNFFEYYDQIAADKRTSPYHFRLKNGGKFDCYLITSKETLGMHSEGAQARFDNMSEEDWNEYKSLFDVDIEEDAERVFNEDELKAYVDSRKGSDRKLWISIDDPIDISFMKERHKETTLEMHFNSSLYGIHPEKWSFTGTRKFEEDFFDFTDKKFGKELVKYIRSTMNPDGSLLCPEMFTHPSLSTFKKDLENGKRDLQKVREHVGEYAWGSEYEQNPHPVTGEVWDNIETEFMLDTPINRKYDLCLIGIDRATTTNTKTSDMTGCVISLRHKKTGNRIIIEDFTDHISFDDLLILINDFTIEFRAKHKNVQIVLVVEKQGGGDDFITMAKNSRVFIKDDGSVVENKIPEICIISDLHNTGNKQGRIQERLIAPIKNGKLRILKSLRNSQVVKQILNFPHSAYFDGIDAVANTEYIILRDYPFTTMGEGDAIEEITKMLDVHDKQEKRDIMKEILGRGKRNVFDSF